MNKRIVVTIFILFSVSFLFSQENVVIRIDEVPSTGVELSPFWKYKSGDSMEWSDPYYDESLWDTINSAMLNDSNFTGNAWFRMRLQFDSSLLFTPLSIGVLQAGACEIYLDGEKLISFGMVGENTLNEERYYPNLLPVSFNFIPEAEHVLAIRYSNHKIGINRNIDYGKGFLVFIIPANELISLVVDEKVNINSTSSIFLFGFIIALGIAHLFIFLFYSANKNNLFYFFFTLLLSLYALIPFVQSNVTSAVVYDWFDNISMELFPLLLILLLLLAYSIFYERFPKVYLFIIPAGIISFLFILFQWKHTNIVLYSFMVLSLIELIRVIIVALFKRKPGAIMISVGIGVFAFFVVTLTLMLLFPNDGDFSGTYVTVAFVFTIISIPVSMSLYLAKQFATTNKNLNKKLIEVQLLSEKTVEQEKEKQKILESQKEILEIQVKERTAEIVEQKKIIEEKNKDITESIDYAQTIQQAILPDKKLVTSLFSNAFILFKPKDIVSGDFYWLMQNDNKKLIAACDCTGHGVPGALMSMVGNNLLTQIVNEKNNLSPAEILNLLHKQMRKTLRQENPSETKDGMDIALISFMNEYEMEYAGAYRPLWIINNGILKEIKADKYAIGGMQEEEERVFTNHKIKLSKGDSIYIFSDGFADQFNDNDEKLMIRRFKDLLLSIQDKDMPSQEKVLDVFIENWRGKHEQVDDILVIGIKI